MEGHLKEHFVVHYGSHWHHMAILINLHKTKLKISYSVLVATSQVFNSHMWLLATVLDRTHIEYFLHYIKFYWIMLIVLTQRYYYS